MILQYPEFFSGGMTGRQGPSEQKIENLHFSITFKAMGWKEKLADTTDKHIDPPNKKLIAEVTAKNPGYGFTCTALLLSAIQFYENRQVIK